MIVEAPSRAGWACDVFCRVVDNFGDIGVCWRLARQLAHEHDWRMRLIVDDLSVFNTLCPQVDAARADQTVEGVRVLEWTLAERAIEPAEVVIEAFGCTLPAPYLDRMPQCTRLWIDLEYLSAETWIDDCHGLPSPQGSIPKYLFFPGFTPRTGGLIVEGDYFVNRERFEQSVPAQAALRASLGLPRVRDPGALEVLVFAYPTPAVEQLAQLCEAAGDRVLLFYPSIPMSGPIHVCEQADGPWRSVRYLTIPFVPQREFDAVLWNSDLAIVRGEDSFVRAQLAGRPFVWHVYPQEGDAHLRKLDAFAVRYLDGLAPEPAEAWHAFNREWNAGALSPRTWDAFKRALPTLKTHASRWATNPSIRSGLARNLTKFVAAKLNSTV